MQRAMRKLAKKYSKISSDLNPAIEQLKQGIFVGDEMQGFSGDNVYKARIASIDQKKGKSGDFRVIYYVIETTQTIYLMNIYAKSEKANIDPDTLEKIKGVIEEIKSLT